MTWRDTCKDRLGIFFVSELDKSPYFHAFAEAEIREDMLPFKLKLTVMANLMKLSEIT